MGRCSTSILTQARKRACGREEYQVRTAATLKLIAGPWVAVSLSRSLPPLCACWCTGGANANGAAMERAQSVDKC